MQLLNKFFKVNIAVDWVCHIQIHMLKPCSQCGDIWGWDPSEETRLLWGCEVWWLRVDGIMTFSEGIRKDCSLFSCHVRTQQEGQCISQVLTGHVGQLIWVSSLENCNEIHFCCLGHLFHGICCGRPRWVRQT